jgi:hypothetical protein
MHHIGLRVYVTAVAILISSMIARVRYGARRVRTAQDGI